MVPEILFRYFFLLDSDLPIKCFLMKKPAMPSKIFKASWQKHEAFIPNGIETLSLPSLNRQFLKVRTVADPNPSILRFRVIRGYFSLDFCLEIDAIWKQLRSQFQ